MAVSSPSASVPRRGAIAPVDLVITAAFAVLLVVQVSRHEMWRDEIHSWGLVLDSPTLSDLFANLRFTGHPGLWYLLLWLASSVTDSPYALQAVHAAIGIALIGMIGLASPFSRIERLLLLASYFVIFEYTVVSRNYGIGFLIALIYAQMRASRPNRTYLNGALLGLLANTNLFAFVLAGALALEYAADVLSRRGRDIPTSIKTVVTPTVIYAALAGLAIATMWPSPDISWRTTGEPLAATWSLDQLQTMLAGTVASLVPTHPLNYWNAAAEGTLSPLGAFAIVPLAAIFVYIFKEYLRLLIISALTAAGSIAIGQLIYANSMRHWGINFIAFVAALWIQRVWTQKRSYPAMALLAVGAIAGIAVSAQQFPATFSAGKETAEWIRENQPSDVALVGTPDTFVTVVAQYLDTPIYFLDCSCTRTYLAFKKDRDAFDESQIPERLARALRDLEGRPVVFLITHDLVASELAELRRHGIEAARLAAFDDASTDENFYVYRVALTNDLRS